MGAKSEYTTETDFAVYKKYILKVAKELGYPSDVINDISSATSEYKIDAIMRSARRKYIRD